MRWAFFMQKSIILLNPKSGLKSFILGLYILLV